MTDLGYSPKPRLPSHMAYPCSQNQPRLTSHILVDPKKHDYPHKLPLVAYHLDQGKLEPKPI
jgi:hypothetical protein